MRNTRHALTRGDDAVGLKEGVVEGLEDTLGGGRDLELISVFHSTPHVHCLLRLICPVECRPREEHRVKSVWDEKSQEARGESQSGKEEGRERGGAGRSRGRLRPG